VVRRRLRQDCETMSRSQPSPSRAAPGGILARVGLVACWLAIMVVPPVRAVAVGAGPLGLLLASADVVLVARVEFIEPSPFDFEYLAFRAESIAVLGGADPIPAHLTLTPAFPIWPADLGVPYEVGTTVIVFLERQSDGLAVINNVRAILPAGGAAGAGAGGAAVGARVGVRYGNLRAGVFDQLSAALGRTHDDRQAARLLVLLAEISIDRDEGTFVPFLDGTGVWSRRAALAALLRLHPTPARVCLAGEDFRGFLASPPNAADRLLLRELYESVLDDRFVSAQEAPGRAAPFLPIYRAIADAPDQLGLEEAALHGLQHAGQRADALRLYAYARSPRPYLRHRALDTLCQMFGVPLRQLTVISYEMPLAPEVVEQEQLMQTAVRAALEREGLLPPGG
jgi:hypothetical protein